MKIIQSSDYRIYFDDVRMDPYVKSWTGSCGLNASDASATISMYRTKSLEDWKGYLTQVRIFARNVFSNKFSILFEGEISSRTWAEQRNDTGEIDFTCDGFYHWLDIPIPLMIGSEDALDAITRFRYEAMNIDVDGVTKLFQDKETLTMEDQPIKGIISALFKAMNAGYYNFSDSTFQWAKLQDRFKVMSDIIKEFRDAGFLDAFTFTRTTQIDSFYVYLTQILTQLMMEFYQDRDGAFRIKNPSWADSILKAHILDESIVQSANGYNNWKNEPTRVLAIGGQQDVARAGNPILGAGNIMRVPMGLYIGLPGKGQYISQDIELQMQNFGTSGDYSGGNGNFFDDITGNYTITSKFGEKRSDGTTHMGTDFGMKNVVLHSIGVSGVVTVAQKGNKTAGNWIIVKENIGGADYYFTYMHLSQIDVKEGDTVSPGQQLGITGSTGESTGPHLHMEIWKGPRKVSGSTAMDPEQFLKDQKNAGDVMGGGSAQAGSDSITKYINQDLKNQSNMNAADINNWINGKAQKSYAMYGMGEAFVEAAKQSGLDPVYLVSHAADETGWGKSNIAKTKFNFYGINAQDSNTGLAYKWNSVSDGIIGGAVWIRKHFYDKGQNTLYKMRFSSNGKHNYASDPLWANKIAEIMSTSGISPGSAASGGSSNNSPNNTNKYVGTPYAATGGYSITTTVVNPTNSPTPFDLASGKSSTLLSKPPKAVDYNSFASSILKYTIPYSANTYTNYIESRPNGVNVNMICLIIEAMSGWREKYKSDGRYGLMGISTEYIQQFFGDPATNAYKLYSPELNIQHGTSFFNTAYTTFNKKVTFALAALYEGSLPPIEAYIQQAGSVDFTKVRGMMKSDTVAFVDGIVDKFCTLFGGNYLKDDPNKLFSSGGGKMQVDLSDNTTPKDYEATYKPVMSDEEKKYKVNLQVTEQLLIRYDASSSGTNGATMNADDLIERYAKYMMQLYRAESHGMTIPLSTCLPFLRPGFNAWLEPTRRDVVFYITGVQHQGAFQQGCFTTVTGGYARSPKSYDQIEGNIFISEMNSSAKDFGEVIAKSDMDKIRTALKQLHDTSDEIVTDARLIPTLSKMYSSAVGKVTDYTTMWNNEFTSSELDAQIKNLYKKAPKVVVQRKADLKKIVDDSATFFTTMLLKTSF